MASAQSLSAGITAFFLDRGRLVCPAVEAGRALIERAGMKKRILLLGYLLTALSFSPSEAAETISAPNVNIDGSVPLQYDTNAARTRQKKSDYVFSPFFRLSASGQLLDDFSYAFYASTGFDDYFRFDDNNVSQSAGGVQVSRS